MKNSLMTKISKDCQEKGSNKKKEIKLKRRNYNDCNEYFKLNLWKVYNL